MFFFFILLLRPASTDVCDFLLLVINIEIPFKIIFIVVSLERLTFILFRFSQHGYGRSSWKCRSQRYRFGSQVGSKKYCGFRWRSEKSYGFRRERRRSCGSIPDAISNGQRYEFVFFFFYSFSNRICIKNQ